MTRPLLAKKKKEPLCPTCKRRRPDGWQAAALRRRSLAIRRGLAKAKNKGRPRKTSYEKIYKAIDKGMSLSQTQKATGATKGTIQHALKIRG